MADEQIENKNLYKKNNLFQNVKRKKCDFLNFHKKNYTLSNPKTTRDSLEYRTIQNYSHMKTILGHVQIDENLSIAPVPIFCMCFSEDGEFIYTGDENGTIKIWSTLTGGIVETFRLFSRNEEKAAIADLLAFNKCLIACNEEKQVVIWNTKTLQIYDSFDLEEELLNINGYKYNYGGITRDLLIIGAKSGNIYIRDMNLKESTDEKYKEIFPIKFHIDKTIQERYNLGRTKSSELSGMSSDDYNGLLVSGFHDGLVCIWDTFRLLNIAIKRRGELFNFAQYVFYAQLCHRTTVHLIEFSPDKTHFLTGSLDGSVLVWRINLEMVNNIRKDYFLGRNINIEDKIPVGVLTTINESDDRIKCSVNVATWTKKNNYIIAMISSKPRKKQRNDNNNNMNEFELYEEELNNKKRTSSLIVYSLKLNKIIHKYNEKSGIKGLNFIDEIYIFGCHPLYEEIIFTLNGTRNIILFNIKSGEIIKKFKQNDFFFESDKKTPLACEGIFSKKGDYFAITTYSGYISIFSIYSKNSYSATYMNQFYSKEFDPNIQQLSNNFNRNGIPSLSSIFPIHVNMYNLPYIIEQPYSSYKLEQIKNNMRIINEKYCIGNKELKQRFLANNFVTYEKNFLERVLECQKEEEAYYNAEKDNMNYRINRNNNNEEEMNNNMEDELQRDEDYNDNIENESNSNENRERNNRRRNNNRYFVENDSDISEDSNNELTRDDLILARAARNNSYNDNNNHPTNNNTNYNLRNRRVSSNNYNNLNHNIQPRNSTRYNLRNHSNSNPSAINDNNNIYDNNYINPHYNLRNRRETENNENTNINNHYVVNNNENENNNVLMQNKSKKKHIIEDDDEDEDFNKNKDKKNGFEYEEEGDIIIINKQKKDYSEEKEKEKQNEMNIGKEKENKEKRNHNKYFDDEEDEEYKGKESMKKKGRKPKKRGRKKKNRNSSDEDEEYDEEYEYQDSENNSEALRGLEAEEYEDELEEKEMREDPDYIKDDFDDETYTLNSKQKKHRKLVKRIDNDSDKDFYIGKNNIKDFKKDPNFSKNKYHKLLMDKIANDQLEHVCYFCHQSFKGDKHSSNKIFGPFYYNEFSGKVSATKLFTNPNNTSEKEIYIDFNCFAIDNDLVQITKKEGIFNPSTSIEEVIKQSKICFRCGSPFATKKCHSCLKMFHGNLCLTQMTVEYNEHKYCLECFKKKISSTIHEKNKTKKSNFSKIKRKFFLGEKIINSQYFPQKEEEVYFILHAYIQFLRDQYQYILFEVEETKQRIFWWMENTYIEKNPRFNFYEPFLCRIKDIEYIFPNDQTIALIKESDISDNKNDLKILIKLQLQIIDLKDTELTIIFCENDNPDFLVRKKIYEQTLQYYNENIDKQNNLLNLEVNLCVDIIKVTLTENQPEENNENFSNSKFNSLKVITDTDKEEQKYSFWDICINGNNNELINKKMKNIMEGLKDTINSVYEKNQKEVEIFWDIVPENNDYDYYNEIPVPMFFKLIVSRLENYYYLNESSLKFDIDLLVNNAIRFNLENSQIAEEAVILRTRFINRIDQLSNRLTDNKQVISNGTNIKINFFSDSGGSGNDSIKKMTGKKRNRLLHNIDAENIIIDKDDDDNDDYLFGNMKKKETRSSVRNSNVKNENISVDIELIDEKNLKRNKRKKI